MSWVDITKRSCFGLALLLVALVAIEETGRAAAARDLEPLLDAVNSSSICWEGNGTLSRSIACDLRLGDQNADRFDLHPAENVLLGFLFQQLARRDLTFMGQVLRGAHVVIAQDPQAEYYRLLTTLPGAQPRISSHASDRLQYGIPEGRIVQTLLVGALGTSVWFQLEGHPWDPWSSPWSSFGHIADFVRYRLSGRNQGPLGSSVHTDQLPLTITAAVPTPKEVCPDSCASRGFDGSEEHVQPRTTRWISV